MKKEQPIIITIPNNERQNMNCEELMFHFWNHQKFKYYVGIELGSGAYVSVFTRTKKSAHESFAEIMNTQDVDSYTEIVPLDEAFVELPFSVN